MTAVAMSASTSTMKRAVPRLCVRSIRRCCERMMAFRRNDSRRTRSSWVSSWKARSNSSRDWRIRVAMRYGG